ncbi:MAG: 4Fe-4S ferredoxin iron-sulfur binding domain-containing protein [candidate division WS6 bacterium GW2011_GWC1_36_11]|uniref:4Fe-4S ferredoxin iron-sulfur binding domain-containing protein n=2 Tax=Candidatus Dojkabacteria TaxID=74243 RepID=A0A0G0DGK9_9BACT|nr:MAG: 4Fe-4S ferredoxin iron-sulfur binding domain-containing protein [candidate division WS6 bacterium GW2011_GWC1_36_11]KKQ04671.1 MAG: 4Fe-4S ferredoxin iron-sulfur binding domain-containing protein [candidate division WS6 bacterium GW2011_WS6_36_26]KKQ16823.1 MAG: 4Fe-4S ferredoxin iron-sulfur binding domain-containing protein [candidate division WS6 bacterium GW2011_GWF1_36_8]HAM96299.1 hypothetical protein [Patescibacteria group bacterium]
MPAIINFKICDNARECSGIAICPTKAMHYDEEKQSIVIDKDKCTSCGLCRPECPIGAIQIGRTDEEYLQCRKEIDEDTRTIKDLFVDRYGASPISEFFMINSNQLEEKIQNENITLIEVYDPVEAQCLLKSIPIKDLTDDIQGDVQYYKLEPSEDIKNKYKITKLPSLLIFKNKTLLGKIEGYYMMEQIDYIKEIIHQIR